MPEISQSQARELAIRLGAIAANRVFQFDSLEMVDLLATIGILENQIEIVSECGREDEREILDLKDDVYELKEDIDSIGACLDMAGACPSVVIQAIRSLQAELMDLKK